ncbi:MAG: TrkH family potassium uptake protein [Oscillospiraceae bacterium]|nr:TrkH family potassium uptake protein [Oscillospiraceae bacterium]
MNRKMVFFIIGRILLLESILLGLPMAVSIYYWDGGQIPLLFSMLLSLALGATLTRFMRPDSQVIYAREGFLITGLAWVIISVLGALPFVLSGEIPSFVDAFFETVSGFTTTGASILTDVEKMSRSMLFWRSFTHWIGGMGMLVLMVAVMPNLPGRTIHILRAEMPGPTMGKLSPKLSDTARILYLLYIALTVVELLLLLAGGMPLFDSAIHTFGTAGTGGFGIRADSVAGYSPYLQWVIAVFMMLFGLNFNLFFLLTMRRFKSVLRSEELWTYVAIVLASTALICWNIRPLFACFSDALRHAFFQVTTISSTTGFSTVNFDSWPSLSRMVLVLLMFIGACAGSTAGGLKVSRVVLLFKTFRREIRHLLHPHSVTTIRFEGRTVENTTLSSVATYFALYMGLFVLFWFIVSFQPGYDGVSNFTAVAACYNNIGPGLNLVGPAGSYAGYSPFVKLVLSLAMLFGRLEIYPMLISLMPGVWLKK